MSPKHFKKGQMIIGEAVELIGSRGLIIQVEGSLIRVKNNSAKAVVKGQKIELIVKSIKPLSFELACRAGSRKHLNVSV